MSPSPWHSRVTTPCRSAAAPYVGLARARHIRGAHGPRIPSHSRVRTAPKPMNEPRSEANPAPRVTGRPSRRDRCPDPPREARQRPAQGAPHPARGTRSSTNWTSVRAWRPAPPSLAWPSIPPTPYPRPSTGQPRTARSMARPRGRLRTAHQAGSPWSPHTQKRPPAPLAASSLSNPRGKRQGKLPARGTRPRRWQGRLAPPASRPHTQVAIGVGPQHKTVIRAAPADPMSPRGAVARALPRHLVQHGRFQAAGHPFVQEFDVPGADLGKPLNDNGVTPAPTGRKSLASMGIAPRDGAHPGGKTTSSGPAHPPSSRPTGALTRRPWSRSGARS